MDGDDPSPRRAHQDLAIDVSASASTLPLARARIRALGQFALRAEGVRHAILSIALVGPRQIAALNRRVSNPAMQVRGVAPEAMRLLVAQEWPGNVRELFNVVENAFTMGGPP